MKTKLSTPALCPNTTLPKPKQSEPPDLQGPSPSLHNNRSTFLFNLGFGICLLPIDAANASGKMRPDPNKQVLPRRPTFPTADRGTDR